MALGSAATIVPATIGGRQRLPLYAASIVACYAGYRIYRLFASGREPKQNWSIATGKAWEFDSMWTNDTSTTLPLSDGRTLGYAEYGSPTGRPVFYLHGLPGSRIEAAPLHKPAMEMGARIIAVDRPGFGWSSPQAGRQVLDHARDIQCLAEHLKLQEYGAFGISGGGPYALACAAGLPPEQLKGITIVCGLGPNDIGTSGMEIMHRLGYSYGFRTLPQNVLRWFLNRETAARLELSDEERFAKLKREFAKSKPHPKDAEVTTDEFLRLGLRSMREAYARDGTASLVEDGRVMNCDFGFRVEDIRKDLPVRLWYGTLDDFVPLNHGIQIASRLGEQAQLRVLDETHTSIGLNWRVRAIKDLVNLM